MVVAHCAKYRAGRFAQEAAWSKLTVQPDHEGEAEKKMTKQRRRGAGTAATEYKAVAAPVVATARAVRTLPLTAERAAVSRYGSGGVLVVGVDEAGRGPLAGPVVAAAVALLDPGAPAPPIEGVNDSKQVPEEDRERLFEAIIASPALVYGVSVIERDVIDDINILQATMRGMEQAVQCVQGKLAAAGVRSAIAGPRSLHVLVDGPKIPAGIASEAEAWRAAALAGGAKRGSAPGASAPSTASHGIRCAEPVIRGDATVYSIAAASLVAKVTRDRIMRAHDLTYPQYGFAVHKGYGTARHMAAIFEHGVSAIHRRTFQPVKGMLEAGAAVNAAAVGGSSACSSAAAPGRDSSALPLKRSRKVAAYASCGEAPACSVSKRSRRSGSVSRNGVDEKSSVGASVISRAALRATHRAHAVGK